MKPIITTLILAFFLCVFTSCASSYDSAPWAKKTQYKKLSQNCKNNVTAKQKRKKTKSKTMHATAF